MISMASIPSLARHYRMQWEQAQGCHVLLYPEGMIKLNDSAAEILLQCDGCNNVAGIVTALEHKFPSAEGLDIDVIEFVGGAHGEGWIRVV
jgi:pyrroloquinoline quinone biosynthesis protein D